MPLAPHAAKIVTPGLSQRAATYATLGLTTPFQAEIPLI